MDSQVTPAKCQEAMVGGKTRPAFSSSVLSLDGTLHFERGDNSTLESDPQMTPAKSLEEAVCGEAAQDLESSVLPVDGASNFDRSDSSFLMTIPQVTPARRKQRETIREIEPVNSAKRLKTANSTRTCNVLSEQSSDGEL